MSNYPIVGIYLGPNDCSIAIGWKNGKVEIIRNYHDERTTPSVVSFTKTKKFVGEAAENEKIENPKNTIYGIREIIGKIFL